MSKKLPPGWGHEQPLTNTRLPLALQMFSVAEQMAKDMVGTLKLVKEAGYDGVEFYGGLHWVAQDIRLALNIAGLQIAGWHTPWEHLSPNNIYATISYNKVLGNQFLIVPWREDEVLDTREACLTFAKELTWVSDVLGQHGMVTGYHNHGKEFVPTSDTGELPWDIIAQNTPSNVIMQLDIGNGLLVYDDMLDMLKKYPGRGGTVHMKPNINTFFDDAQCTINWDEYFSICRKEAGVRWYIVEYVNPDRHPNDPAGAIKAAAKWFMDRGGR
ncbi:MAG: sugar phosphate isomerase/epimerase [Defluviitaleaceae bacterium]|nr:sugar phosphate isomerase/epimerase [Defluviitaleaceae bacterium]